MALIQHDSFYDDRFILENEETGTFFVWGPGRSEIKIYGSSKMLLQADAIKVWDYSQRKCTIATIKGMRQQVARYIKVFY